MPSLFNCFIKQQILDYTFSICTALGLLIGLLDLTLCTSAEAQINDTYDQSLPKVRLIQTKQVNLPISSNICPKHWSNFLHTAHSSPGAHIRLVRDASALCRPIRVWHQSTARPFGEHTTFTFQSPSHGTLVSYSSQSARPQCIWNKPKLTWLHFLTCHNTDSNSCSSSNKFTLNTILDQIISSTNTGTPF